MSTVETMRGADELLAAAKKAADTTDWSRAADVLATGPKTVSVLDKRAFYLSRAKRYDEAREVLALLRIKEPANFLWQHMTGYQYYEEGRYHEAVPWFLAAYRLNRTHLRNLYRLAQARRHQGELVRATLVAGEVLKLWHALPAQAQEREARTLAKASYLLARMQVDRDPHGAIGLLQQAAKYDSSDHDKHYMLGKTYRRVGQPQQGLEALQRAQRIKPGRIYIELELADAFAVAGKTADASRCLNRALRGARGWQAWKAARVALSLGRVADAHRMLDVAARDEKVKSTPQYEELRAKLEAARPAEERTDESRRPRPGRRPRESERKPGSQRPREGEGKSGSPSTGKVHHVRVDRGFGFLVDDADGERCYFKLRDGKALPQGQAVRFARVDTERGPAARDVVPAA